MPPSPSTITTRDDVLRAIERLRAAATLLELHARRCTDPAAVAHEAALRRAGGMVRTVVERRREEPPPDA